MRDGIRMAAAVVLTFGPPLAFRFLLRSEVSPALILLPGAVMAGLETARFRLGPRAAFLGPASFAAASLTAVLLLSLIVITPLSAYAAWLESLRAGAPRGTASNIMVAVIAYFSSLLGPAALSAGIAPALAGTGIAAAAVLVILFQNPSAFGAAILLAALAVAGSAAWRGGTRPAPEGKPAARAAGGALAVGALLLALAAAWFLPRPETPQGIALVDASLSPGLRDAVLALFPRFPLLYDIPGYGISYGTEKLGGTPVLSTLRVFRVEGPPGETVYLRTAAYDLYDGSSWKVSGTLAGIASARDAGNFLAAADGTQADRDIRITLQGDFYGAVPFTLDTDRILFAAGKPEAARGDAEIGFSLQKPMTRGAALTLRRSGADAGTGTKPRLEPRVREACLQLPAELPEEVRALAAQLAGEEKDPARVLANIEDFMAESYSYSLHPPQVPGDRDFVDSFLFDNRQGYCVHFATTFTVLCRLCGIPARYVTGFLASIPSGGRADVSGLNAHAWAEAWMDGRGWVTREATAALNPSYYTDREDGWVFRFGRGAVRAAAQQIGAVFGGRLEEADAPARFPALLLLLPAGAVLAVALFLSARAAGISPVLLFLDPRRRFLYRAGRLARAPALRDLPVPRHSGWTPWAEAWALRAPAEREAIRRFLRAVLEAAYSDRPFDKQAAVAAKGLLRRLRAAARGTSRRGGAAL